MEIVKLNDIDLDEKTILIHGKGKKERKISSSPDSQRRTDSTGNSQIMGQRICQDRCIAVQ